MVYTITITGNDINKNSSDQSNNPNNLLTYKFPTTAMFDNHSIAVTSISMYLSWYNIDAELYNNNIFTYTWLDPSGSYQTYTVNFPNGLYEVPALNNYLEYIFIQRKQYSINPTNGAYVFYITLTINPTAYSINAVCYQVPQFNPASPPATGNIPQFTQAVPFAFIPQIQFNDSFNKICGYTQYVTSPTPVTDANTAAAAGTTLPTSIVYQSNIAPQVNPVPTLALSCPAIDNPYASPTSTLYSLNATGVIGSQIQVFPPQLVWLQLKKGNYSNLSFTWAGANGLPVFIRDPNMCIVLAIRDNDTDVINIKS